MDKVIANRLANPNINPVLSSAFNNAISDVPNMKIIELEGFATVQKTLSELAVKKPEWFPAGFNGIHVVANDNLFAATLDNTVYFSAADKLATGFKPAIELNRAVQKSGTKEALSFNEEYALETLWHELNHMTYQHRVPSSVKANTVLESAVQFHARYSYQQLLTELNLPATHQQKIIANGYAYDVEVANFRTLIAALNLDDLSIVTVVDDVLKRNTSSDVLINELAVSLSTLTSYSLDKIEYGLKNLNRQFGFKEKLTKKLGY
jgi:hypothetical protein